MPKQFESAVVNTQPSITNSKKPRIKIDTDLESGDIVTCSKKMEVCSKLKYSKF